MTDLLYFFFLRFPQRAHAAFLEPAADFLWLMRLWPFRAALLFGAPFFRLAI